MIARFGAGIRSRRGYRAVISAPVLLAALLLTSLCLRAPALGAAGTPVPAVSCPATPVVFGEVAATPLPVASPVPAIAASPVAAGGLQVRLEAASDQAGPGTLTVLVADPTCGPVSGATVTISTQSLDMNMGVETNQAAEQAPGRYVATGVALGMGGRWKADVKIERPGQPPVTAEFLFTLKGPM